jgi:hypothetical protein
MAVLVELHEARLDMAWPHVCFVFTKPLLACRRGQVVLWRGNMGISSRKRYFTLALHVVGLMDLLCQRRLVLLFGGYGEHVSEFTMASCSFGLAGKSSTQNRCRE